MSDAYLEVLSSAFRNGRTILNGATISSESFRCLFDAGRCFVILMRVERVMFSVTKLKKLIVLLLLTGGTIANASVPTIDSMQFEKHIQWVLINSAISFLVPTFQDAGVGTAYVGWTSVPGALSYQYRIFSNGQWSNWLITGAENHLNLTRLVAGANATIELRACFSTGCSTETSQAVLAADWQNVGTCDPKTGMQMQICAQGFNCPLNTTRNINGGCLAVVDCQ